MDAGGTDPGGIAGSDDGNYAYVYFQSAALIRRFNLQGHSADLQFPATMTGAPSQVVVTCMKVIQGNPDTIAVSFVNPAIDPGHVGIALFHLGAQLPNTVPGNTHCETMAYGATPATMWCHDSEDTAFTLYQLSVDGNGIQTVGPGLPGLAYGFSQTPQFYNGRLFFNSLGLIVDPVQRLQVAMLPEVGTPTGDFTVDPDAGLVYFSRANNFDRYFWVLDGNRFTPVAYVDTIHAPNNQWIKNSMVRCGAGGLAGINESGQLAVVPVSVIAPLPLVTPGAPTSDTHGALRLAMPNQSLAYSPLLGKLYATVPDSIPGLGNSIVPLDPNSLIASNPLWIGSRPSLMAVTQDGQHLYQELNGSNVLRRINLALFTPDLDTPLYGADGAPNGALSLVPLPASPDSIAILRGELDATNAVAVYDHGVARPQTAAAGWDTVLGLSDTGSTLYGLNGQTTSPGFDSYAITPPGVSLLPGGLLVSQTNQFYSDLKCADGICVTSYGIVIDAVNSRVLGICPISGFGSPLLDAPDRRVYFLVADANDIRITSCNLDTFLPAEQFTLAAQPEFAGNLVLWQADQFAFNTGNEIITLPKSALAAVPPTPAPQPSSVNGTVQLPLSVNSGVYDPVRDRLYVPLTYSNAGTSGNSIGVIRPDTGVLESTIPIGGEPTTLTLSGDASRLFVALHYAQAVLQVNLATRAIEQRILLGSEVSALGPVPGQPTSVIVADQTSLHAFDNGVERPGVVESLSLLPAAAIAFGPPAGAFYSLNSTGSVAAWQLTSSGIVAVGSALLNDPLIENALTMTAIGNNLYADGGSVLSIPSLAWINQIPNAGSVTADPVTQQIYVAWSDSVSVYSAASLAVTSRLAATGAQHRPLVPCGPQRLASLAGGIVFYSPSSAALPHLPQSLVPDSDGITRLNVPVSGAVWDTQASQLIATTLPAAGPDGNSLFSLNPASGKLQIATRVDNQPSQISLAPDAHIAYVAASGAGTIARVNLDSWVTERSWTVSVQNPGAGAIVPYQIVALSASTDSLIVNASSRYTSDAAFFLMAIDNGAPRPDMLGLWPNTFFGSIVAADNTGQHVYLGANSWLSVNASGITTVPGPSIAGVRSFTQAAACGTLLYLNSGQAIDPLAGKIVSDYGNAAQPDPGPSDRIACDAANDRVLYLTSTQEAYTLRAFQRSTGTPQGQLLFGNVSGSAADLIPAGPSFAALRTDQSLLLLPLSRLTASQPTPAIAAVVNAATYAQGGLAPGSIVTIFGSGLASWVAQATSFPLASPLAGASLSVGGQTAYPLDVSPTQINLVLPTSLPAGEADLEVSVAALSAKITISIVPTAPGVFTAGRNHAVVQNQDYSTNSPTNPAAPGSVVIVYFTGQGMTMTTVPSGQPAPDDPESDVALATTTATVGGQPATVLYSGLTPGLSGLAQANIQLPSLASGDYELVLKVGSATSNTSLISVK